MTTLPRTTTPSRADGSIATFTPFQQQLARLRERGFALCKLDPGEKKPTYQRWGCRSLEPSDFGVADGMVGILGGPLSNGNRPDHALVITDLDAREAVERGDKFLPPTGMIESRAGKPRSHRYYLVPFDTIPPWAVSYAQQAAPAAKEATGHVGPFKKQFRHSRTDDCILDFIGTGGQAVAPPSVWVSEDKTRTEPREWEGGEPGEPAVIPFPDLWTAVCRLADACKCRMPSGLSWPWEPSPRLAASAPAQSRKLGKDTESRAIAYITSPRTPAAVEHKGGHDTLFTVARAVVWGFDLGPERGFKILKEHYNPRCKPVWSDNELLHKCEDADTIPFDKPRGWLRDAPLPEQDKSKQDTLKRYRVKIVPSTSGTHHPPAEPSIPTVAPANAQQDIESVVVPTWPDPLAPEALHGPIGDLVRAIEPHSEADPAALLFQGLVAFGNVVGRGPHFQVEADEHHGNEFVLIVGDSSKARKGTSWGQIKRVFEQIEPDWVRDRVTGGLSSGEGLIHEVRDKRGNDAGVDDKRLLAVESEFANVLKQTERQGNVLSVIIRQGWEGSQLRTIVKTCPDRATGAHISTINHITGDELRRYLTATESANGFANRHMIVCARRSKLRPRGGTPDQNELAPIIARLKAAVTCAKKLRRVCQDAHAERLWDHVYERLSTGRPGMTGSLTGRAEAHVTRLSLLYALLDSSPVIQKRHLQAALACWDYVAASVRFVFGDSLGDPLADSILAMLRGSTVGLTRTELSGCLGNNRKAADIVRALDMLARNKLAEPQQETSATGRPPLRWFAIRESGT